MGWLVLYNSLILFFLFAEHNFPSDVVNAWFGPDEPSLTIVTSGHVDYAGQVVAIAVAG